MSFLIFIACKPPPPAPEGLDATTSYMMREFYSEDELFEAGIQGFMNWFNTEGHSLVGEAAVGDNTDTFTLNDLSEDDISHLPIEDDGRDFSRAKGVISLAEMECTWQEAEAYFLRGDQEAVFSGDWEGYERNYLSDREVFSNASQSGVFMDITEDLDPFSGSFDHSSYSQNVMMTVNQADPSSLLGVDIPAYELYLDFRHGTYVIDEEEIGVSAIITYQKSGAYDEDGENGLAQSYSIELNISTENDKTLRALAVWAEPVSNILEPDSPTVLNYAVNKSLDSSERISAICSGDVEIPAE